MKQKLTIQDIARLAGVSKATVSRVLNHKPTVDQEIRERVMKIVNEQGFVPSITATVLRGGRTQLIGVLAPPLTQPFVPEIMLGVAEVTDRTEYEVVLYTMHPSHKHSEVVDRILGMKLSTGLLAIMPGQLGSHLDRLSRQGVPIVTIEDQVAPTSTHWIGIDNVSSAYEATHYLLSLGHRRIGHILGPENYICSRERYIGYCRALREVGLEPDPNLVWQGDFDLSGGRAIVVPVDGDGERDLRMRGELFGQAARSAAARKEHDAERAARRVHDERVALAWIELHRDVLEEDLGAEAFGDFVENDHRKNGSSRAEPSNENDSVSRKANARARGSRAREAPVYLMSCMIAKSDA